MPEAYALAVGRIGKSADLRFLSAASSIGAEVDSVLSLQGRNGHASDVRAKGYDINQLAVAAAGRGIYRAYAPYPAIRAQQMCLLQNMGFDASDVTGDRVAGLFTEVDATPVRRGHEVEFARHNLLEPLPESGSENLVTANNVLYYLSLERAVEVVRNLCQTLADNGVIGLGSVTMYDPEWRKELAGVMDDEFDMEPLFEGSSPMLHDVPVIFGRI